MFRTLIYPSSGACDYSVELPHWSYCSWFDVCWSFGVVGLEWYPCCRLKHNWSVHELQHTSNQEQYDQCGNSTEQSQAPDDGYINASACNTDTTPTQPHRNSNTHYTKNNNTTNVVIQQNSRKLLMMDILMSETCWAHKKWNKIASDIKLVLYPNLVRLIRMRCRQAGHTACKGCHVLATNFLVSDHSETNCGFIICKSHVFQ